MTVTFGVGLFPTEPAARVRELTSVAERLGYVNAWFGDSQNIWRECFTTMAASAVGTTRIVFGSGVTNALTRHRSVLASTFATLSELTDGRVVVGIGTGDSALRTMGLRPLRLAELEAAVEQLRSLLAGLPVREETSTAAYHLDYLPGPQRIPIYIAASAPNILRLAGRVADGVIALVGTDPRFIRAALATIEDGAREGGRQLEDLHVVLWTPTAIEDDGNVARDLVRAHVARVVIRPLPAVIEARQMAAVERIRERYDYYHHMDPEAIHGGEVPDDLVNLFALAGTEAECTARLREILPLGVDQVAIVPFTPRGGDRAETMARFARVAAIPSLTSSPRGREALEARGFLA